MTRARRALRRLAARFVVLDADHVLAPGELAWDARGQVVSLRRARGPVADVCVLPGLVNAHAHLQLSALRDGPRSFLPWVGAVMAQRAATSARAERAQLQASIEATWRGGATAVGDIDSSGGALPALGAAGLAGRCYRELTGFHLDGPQARALLRDRRQQASHGVATGWSPHAPYSVSPALFQAARADRRHLAVHCAELPEEQQFLRTGNGPFADLLRGLGRLPADFVPPGVGAVRWLERLGLLRRGTLLVHGQELERGDVPRIAGSGAAIVVCPGTIEYFRRSPPPVPRWLSAGIPVALGTDSLASNDGLSMQRELQRAARFWPELSPRQLLAMATTNGALGLGRPGLGRLRRGGRADFVVVSASARRDPWQALAAFTAGEPLLQVVGAGVPRCGLASNGSPI